MNNCLRAGFSRLWKSRFFFLLLLFFFGEGALSAYTTSGYVFDNGLLGNTPTVMFLGGLFTAVFIGTDFSDGTVRNKLVVGKSRAAVYFSNLIVCCAAAELMNLTYLLSALGFGLIFEDAYVRTAGEILFRLMIGNIALLAATALTVLLCMLIRSRSSSIVVTTLFSIGMIFFAQFVGGRLAEPEYFEGRVYVDEDGNLRYDTETKEANPYYIDGTAREALETVYRASPSGQMSLITSLEEIENGGQLMLDSAGVFLAANLFGYLGFRKGDLK